MYLNDMNVPPLGYFCTKPVYNVITPFLYQSALPQTMFACPIKIYIMYDVLTYSPAFLKVIANKGPHPGKLLTLK